MIDRKVRRTVLALAAVTLLVPLTLVARPLRGRGARLGPPAFLTHLYPPRFVMQNQDTIELTAEQRSAITAAITESRRTLVSLEQQRDAATAAVARLVGAPRVDEVETLARAADLMATEAEIKRSHLRLLIRVKNQLTPEQQTALDDLRSKARTERQQRRRERRAE